MKTKITFQNFSTTVIILLLLLGFSTKAQTYVYDETTTSGMYIDGGGSEVPNPVSDDVNSSANCAKSGTAGSWQKTEFFPSYSPVSGSKLYFSVYNPENVSSGQIKFFYTSAPSTEQWGGNVNYVSSSVTGWVEYSLDLTSHLGNEINKILMYTAGDSSSAVYIDNIYFGTQSVLAGQTIDVYNDTTSSGMFIDGNGAEISNPISDDVNSSTKCARTGTGGWKKIEYFPTYTPVSGDKLYFSIYNPNNIGTVKDSQGGQIKFYYSSAPSTEQWGGNVNYTADSVTGWVEYSLDLTEHVDKQINKILLYPGGSSSTVIYIDNIYFAKSSVLSTKSVVKVDNLVSVSKDGSIQFQQEQNNTYITVFDLTGKLILQEKINGTKGEKTLNQKGIYILRVKSLSGVSTQKVVF